MPRKGVTVDEERQRFLQDYRLGNYSIAELSGRFDISRETAHKWINRFEQSCREGFGELSRRPHSYPNQTLSGRSWICGWHPNWGPAVLPDLPQRPRPRADLPRVRAAARILARVGPGLPRRLEPYDLYFCFYQLGCQRL